MSRKSVVAGILVSLFVPVMAYFAIVVSIHLSSLQESPEDFQYHDSYFTVMHIDPYLFPVIAVTTFTIYAAISRVVRYVKRKA
ncbi:hypothetical protein LJR153_002532 [Paenibacillus sp. LjRoot153]|uniref:hypothetical protein n=1 Tax=Paenibacillus sp. LjRoot153 TaxID=3342270 RepID=UPI003ECF2176